MAGVQPGLWCDLTLNEAEKAAQTGVSELGGGPGCRRPD